ncbi:hypothetical protein NHX12_029429 [Muraenolepis orangiensis]|uniref:Uncharacterized protein n=1 Tax=Muraenolepis orangiensis TaxID=630683 RepID=A0A9Q0IN58_9TELE|nr:hypothetical protein NHX12_029429 [Muraenolepis orangiensis]
MEDVPREAITTLTILSLGTVGLPASQPSPSVRLSVHRAPSPTPSGGHTRPEVFWWGKRKNFGSRPNEWWGTKA